MLACARAEDGGEAPRVGEACETGAAARCGIATGADDREDTIVVCENEVWTSALGCEQGETCFDDDARGAVGCTVINDEIVYGEYLGPCDVAGAQACSFDRDFVIGCEQGEWALARNCSTEALSCDLVTPDEDAQCDAAECVGCR